MTRIPLHQPQKVRILHLFHDQLAGLAARWSVVLWLVGNLARTTAHSQSKTAHPDQQIRMGRPQ